MKNYRKLMALSMSLLTCVSAASMPVYVSFADDDEVVSEAEDTAEVAEETYTEDETDTEEKENIISGDYTYKENDDGTITLVSCTILETELDVPSSIDGKTVTEIGADAFLLCAPKVEKINIPATVSYISSENPFVRCELLKEITVDEESEYFCAVDGVIFSKDMKTLINYPISKEGSSYTIPDGVEKLATAALYEADITEVSVPDSLAEMERHAFAFSNIKSIDLSKTKLYEINTMAFAECRSLKEVILPQELEVIRVAAFQSCELLEEITLPETLYSINQNAFLGTGIKKISVPASVESIGYNALGYDEDYNPISDFVIVGETGSGAYAYCSDADTDYDYQNDFKFLTFEQEAEIQEYLALDLVTEGDYQYYIENNEAVLVICQSAESVLTVPDTFGGCPVTRIYKVAFQDCNSSEIILPESVKTIGEDAFPNTLIRLTIPGGCTEIEGDEPFLGCNSLESITVTEGDGAYSSQDGVLYDHDKTVLIAYPASKEDFVYTAPSSVNTISISAVYGNPFIKKAFLSSVTDIGAFAFENCSNLSEVELSKNIKTIGGDAFYNCLSLKSIRLYDTLESLGEYSFGYYYDSTGESTEDGQPADAKTEGFKIYAPKDSQGYYYGTQNGFKVVTGTLKIGNKNVDAAFLYVICGIVAAFVLGFIGVLTGKKMKKKKSEKKPENTAKEEVKEEKTETNEKQEDSE